MGGSDSYHGQAIATDRSGNTLCDPQSGYRRQRSTVSRGRTWSVSKVPPVSPHGRTDGELVLQRCAAVSSTTSYELRISSGGGETSLRAGSPGSSRSISNPRGGPRRYYLECEPGKQGSVFFVGGTPTAGIQVRRSRLSTIQDASEKIRRSTPGQIAP